MVLLDRNFCVLDIAFQDFVEEIERPNSVGWLAEDVKLREHNGRLLATLVMSSESGKYFQAGFEQRFCFFQGVQCAWTSDAPCLLMMKKKEEKKEDVENDDVEYHDEEDDEEDILEARHVSI